MVTSKFRLLFVLSALLLFGFGQVAYAVPDGCPIEGAEPLTIGPVNPNNGFPQFVVDSTGLSLELCLDSDPPGSGLPPNCFYDPPDPDSTTFSNQIGFGAEAFWWAADATIDEVTAAGPISAILVQAVEAAFLTETPRDGDQFPFTRLRIRIDVPVAGTYFVTHPYGQETYFVAEGDLGPGQEIRDSFDIQFFANSVHQGRVGPLLVWDPLFPPAAPVGFVGEGATLHEVTGSPCGTNYFRIEGPFGVGGNMATVETDLFVVQGKLSTNFGLAVDRATYTRDDTEAGSIDIFASSVSDQTLVVSGNTIGSTAMTGDGTGKYFASIPFTTLPTFITVTNISDDPDTVLTPVLTDLVTIDSAQYDQSLVSGQLSVVASSSDALAPPPALTVDQPSTSDIPPAAVTVSSTAGGSDTEPVVVVGTFPDPGVCAISVDPLSLDLGSVDVGATSTLALTINNNGSAPCIIDALTLAGSTAFALNPAAPMPIFAVAPGSSVAVAVDYTPVAIGTDSGTLEIFSNDPAGPIFVALSGTGAAACTIAVAPLALDFGGVGPGTTATLSVTIGNTGSDPCIIDALTLAGSTDFALNSAAPAPPFNVEPGVPVAVAVDYTPADAGIDSGTLDISSGSLVVSVALSGGLEQINVQRAQFRTGKNEWRIDGTTTVPGPGNFIHIHLGDAVGTELGETEVDNLGAWSFKERNSPILPDGATEVTVHSTGGAIVTVPLDAR